MRETDGQPLSPDNQSAVRDGKRPLGVPPHAVLAVCNSVWYGLMTRAGEVQREAQGAHLPAWRRKTRGELRWPVSVTVVVAIVLQLLLPDQLSLRPLPGWLMPTLEGGLLVGLAISNPVRIEHRARFVRWASLVLIFVLTGGQRHLGRAADPGDPDRARGRRRPGRCWPPARPSGPPT